MITGLVILINKPHGRSPPGESTRLINNMIFFSHYFLYESLYQIKFECFDKIKVKSQLRQRQRAVLFPHGQHYMHQKIQVTSFYNFTLLKSLANLRLSKCNYT